jgi:hypothetical protein
MPHQQNSLVSSPAIRPEPRHRVWPGRLFLAVLLALVGVLFWQRQAVSDWIQLYGYKPPAQITALANQTTMTNNAQHLFYLNQPTIATKTTFANHCKAIEKTIVLGCYHGGQNGIFILEINDNSELHGVMQVTAAHEMLHAAYDRLKGDEKAQINRWLQQYYDTGLHDSVVKAEIDSYRTSEPDELLNEMHSIFGTEIASLPPNLERYYSRYFDNRSAVVQQAEQYQKAFRSREADVKAYDRQLAGLQKQIETNEATLQAKARELQQLRTQLNQYRSTNKADQYNALVKTYNNQAHSYNALLATTRSQISRFNSIVQKRNALVVEEQQLVKQLSGSNLPTVQ